MTYQLLVHNPVFDLKCATGSGTFDSLKFPSNPGTGQEELSHCSGVSMTADAHELPMSTLFSRHHLMRSGAHRAPLQCASALTERRYNASQLRLFPDNS